MCHFIFFWIEERSVEVVDSCTRLEKKGANQNSFSASLLANLE